MQRAHRSTRQQGFTLVEVLVSVFVLGLTVGIIFSVIIVSNKVWMQVSSRSQAFPPAYAALSRISNDLRDAAYVWSPQSTDTRQDWIIIYEPQVNASGINTLPLAVNLNGLHYYYLADTSGKRTSGNPQNTMWLATLNETSTGSTTTVTNIVLAQNVQALSFQTDQDSTRMYAIYSMALTVVGQQQSYQYSSQFSTQIDFNNPTVTVAPIEPTFLASGELGQ